MTDPNNEPEQGISLREKSLQEVSLQDTTMQREDKDVLQAEIAEEKDVFKENINYVTPYAFSISEKIYGLPLAKPRQRMTALVIDGVMISMLTLVSYVVLFGLYAGLFFNAARHFKSKDKNPLIRKLLRGLGVFCFIIFAMSSIHYLLEEPEVAEINVKETNAKEADLKERAAQEQTVVATEIVGADPAIQNQDKNEGVDKNDSIENAADGEKTDGSESKSSKSDSSENESSESEKQKAIPDISQGFLPWVEGVLKQFGVSFGWAAFYFSIFVGWFSGQTPGKYLVGIKIIKLDGEDLNLWEAFGRYGGYAAGFATGLIGFLQVYWDPNRQAIQDKISGTLVIDIKGKRLTQKPLNLL